VTFGQGIDVTFGQGIDVTFGQGKPGPYNKHHKSNIMNNYWMTKIGRVQKMP
jgi:hypothetical protein